MYEVKLPEWWTATTAEDLWPHGDLLRTGLPSACVEVDIDGTHRLSVELSISKFPVVGNSPELRAFAQTFSADGGSRGQGVEIEDAIILELIEEEDGESYWYEDRKVRPSRIKLIVP